MEDRISATTSVKISMGDYESFSTSFSFSRDRKENESRENAAKDVVEFTESVVRNRIKRVKENKNGKRTKNVSSTANIEEW